MWQIPTISNIENGQPCLVLFVRTLRTQEELGQPVREGCYQMYVLPGDGRRGFGLDCFPRVLRCVTRDVSWQLGGYEARRDSTGEVCPPRPQDGRVGRMSLVLSIIAECVAGGNVVVYESERVELMLLATI